MKKLIWAFLIGIFIVGCQPEKIEPDYQLKEDSTLKLGIKELMETGTTNKLEGATISIDNQKENSSSLKSSEPVGYTFSYRATPDPATDCCDVTFLGSDEYNLSNPFLLIIQEWGMGYNFYDEQWIHWVIDEINAKGNVVQNVFDSYRPSYASFNDVECDDPFDYGSGLWYPSGTIAPGYYRITVEKGYTDVGNSAVCAKDIGYAWYGMPSF